MILLRPTINLYYDTVIDGVPVPNGVSEWKIVNDKNRIPFMTSAGMKTNDQVIRNTYFLNVMKANNVNYNIFTKKDNVEKLYYPLELSQTARKTKITDVIPNKTLAKIKKRKMKLLLLYQQYSCTLEEMEQFRDRVYQVTRVGIPKQQIVIVLSELQGSYKNFFNGIQVVGIDWWQIAHQLILKTRYGIEDYTWVSMSSNAVKLSKSQKEKEQFDISKWNTPGRIFTAYTGKQSIQNIGLLTELDRRGFLINNYYSLNLFDKKIPKDRDTVFRYISNDSDPDSEIEDRKQSYDKLINKQEYFDYSGPYIEEDSLRFDSKYLYDSVISLVTDKFYPLSKVRGIDALWAPQTFWHRVAIGHPFIFLGSLNIYRYLNDEGYHSSTDLFRDFYDRISNLAVKTKMIVDQVERLESFDEEELLNRINETKPFMKLNQQKFLSKTHTWKFYDLFTEIENEKT